MTLREAVSQMSDETLDREVKGIAICTIEDRADEKVGVRWMISDRGMEPKSVLAAAYIDLKHYFNK